MYIFTAFLSLFFGLTFLEKERIILLVKRSRERPKNQKGQNKCSTKSLKSPKPLGARMKSSEAFIEATYGEDVEDVYIQNAWGEVVS